MRFSSGDPDEYSTIGQTATWKIWSFQPYMRDNPAINEQREYYKVSITLQGRLAANKNNYHSGNTTFRCTCPATTWQPEYYCKHIAYLIINRYEP